MPQHFEKPISTESPEPLDELMFVNSKVDRILSYSFFHYELFQKVHNSDVISFKLD